MKRSLKMLFAALFATVLLASFAIGADAAWSYQWLIEPSDSYQIGRAHV